MNLIKAENRELTHSRYQSTKGIPTVKIRRPAARGYYLALTFGTLLSSQGADAQQSGPRGLSSLADCPTIHRTRMFPAPGSDPVPSRAGAVHGEQYTKLSGPAGGPSAGAALSGVEHNTRRPPGLPVTAATCVSGRLPDAGRPIRSSSDRATTRPSPGGVPLRATSVTAGIRRSVRRPHVGGTGR